ncbi:unnamed protein product [Triticum turgidum subsp. durum]|uniref:Uncharacterized protein n=1 Tax=Triticum turgidum subsp. durum TaxID=4567 RepID=A0A9R0SE13_TRITD|nr:unnamed protein product [Triticum turgidum subsp. durum]
MALSSSRPHHLLRRFHASARALSRVEPHEFSQPSDYLGSWAEPARVANEERKAAKAAAAQTRAAERRAFELDFRQALMKERAQKLESWRNKEKLKAQKKAEHRELLRRQSSVWVAEDKMEKKILEAIMHTTPL